MIEAKGVSLHATRLIERQENATFIRMNGGNISVERRGKAYEKCLV